MTDISNKAPSGEAWRTTPLESFPPPEKWDDWVEYDSSAWPRRVERHYRLVPTICFNCEAGCGLVAYVDKETERIRKFEGNPYHPGSRGRNCAKGPATLSQVHDPERILYPMKRTGPRGSGQFERVGWDEVIQTLAGRIRKALEENRKTEIMYHVGRPGADGTMDRILKAWGVDGHNSHTNVCSAAARLGYTLWSGSDRPSPDHAHARFILMISAHLETGHYFNPHAQRIIEAKMAGAKICTIDVRLSNTASMSDYWLAPQPGTEAALILGLIRVVLVEDLVDWEFVEQWTNWRSYLERRRPDAGFDFSEFKKELKTLYDRYTPEFTAEECGVDAGAIVEIAREIGKAGRALATHVWRSAASGNEGGWQVARCLQFLCVLTGSVGTRGGSHLASTNKFKAAPFASPPPQSVWNELLYPREWPFAHHELSFLLPHLLKDGRGRIDTYFTRVYNPVWTNPDGFSWIEMLADEDLVGCHAALTPVWNETALWADFVLPMGLAPERHDIMSQETHAARWIGFRQPVLRTYREQEGRPVTATHEANPGEVWEEDEFWIDLSWAIDPDGSLGVRKWFESPYRPGEKITVDEYYRWIFENSVPGLPEAAAKEGLEPLEYMRSHGCFEVEKETYEVHKRPVDVSGAELDPSSGVWMSNGVALALEQEDGPVAGFATPSRRLEFFSETMEDWGLTEHSLPGYIQSHVHSSRIDRDNNGFVLVPTFRLPTLIHTRSANSKWLYELSNRNPLWVNTKDAERLGVQMGDLVRVKTRIGHFVNRVWVTEGMRPGVVACSHHLGRWRLAGMPGTDRWAAAPAEIERVGEGQWRLRRTGDIAPFESEDSDSSRIYWKDGGVHQNLCFPVQPDPISGMHCWHQVVTVEKAGPDDAYGDVFVDTRKSYEVYREWLERAIAGPRPDGLRRPLWFARAVRPADETYWIRD